MNSAFQKQKLLNQHFIVTGYCRKDYWEDHIHTIYEKGLFNKTPGPLLANRPSIITLNLQSHYGSPYELPSLSLLTCKLSTDKSPAIDCHRKEMPNTGESIIISFTPQYPGVHQLQVQVEGTDILDSSCTFPVTLEQLL